MRGKELLEKMSLIDSAYIYEADDKKGEKTDCKKFFSKHRLIAALAALLSMFLVGAGVVGVIVGDLWIQNPSKDPAESVRTALENQLKKDYAIKIEIYSVCVDEEETRRVVERFISGVIADRRSWSDEYLAEHFTVVRAEYYAEYDHNKTTRSDGNLTQYFYLIRDTESGQWSIVDNSGNVNWSERETASESTDAVLSYEEQLFEYLSQLFDKVYSPYYDGLHYEIKFDKTNAENGEWKARFLWTMYHIGKGWDISSDEGIEQEGNLHLEATVKINTDGTLDFNSIEIFADSGANGPAVYNIPLHEFFPKQLEDEQ